MVAKKYAEYCLGLTFCSGDSGVVGVLGVESCGGVDGGD